MTLVVRIEGPAAPAPRSTSAFIPPAPRRGRRLQRSRKKGARTPEGVIYAGRPSFLGNPFRSDRFGHLRAVRLHRRWLAGTLGTLELERMGFGGAEVYALARLRRRVMAALPRLAGRDLQCWCAPGAPCHVETLLDLAIGRLLSELRPEAEERG